MGKRSFSEMWLVGFVNNITLETSGILMMQAWYNKAGAGVIEVVETIGVRTLLETQKAPFYMNDTIPNKPVINNLLQHDFSGPGFKVLGVMWEMISMGLSNILLHVFYDEFQSEDYPKRKTLMPQPLRRRGANGA